MLFEDLLFEDLLFEDLLFEDGWWTGLAPSTALWASSMLLAAAVLISALEALREWRDFRDGGIYSWTILALRHRLPSASAKLLAKIFDFPGILFIYTMQAAAAMAILASPWAPAGVRPGLVIVALTLLMLRFRQHVGLDGADQMHVVVALPLALQAMSPQSEVIRFAALTFIAAQTCLAYLAAGLSKISSPSWRSGEALSAILDTRAYGQQTLARWLSEHPRLRLAFAWSVIAMECLFPLALVFDPPYFWIFIGWGLAFHLVCAVVMGLNNFLWAFAAAYPALLWSRSLMSS